MNYSLTHFTNQFTQFSYHHTPIYKCFPQFCEHHKKSHCTYIHTPRIHMIVQSHITHSTHSDERKHNEFEIILVYSLTNIKAAKHALHYTVVTN